MSAFADREITLTSVDGAEFKVSTKVANLSVVLQSFLGEDDDEEKNIPVPNVRKEILGKVIEFGNHYITEPMTEFVKVRV